MAEGLVGCLISLIILAIVVLIILWAAKAVLSAFEVGVPPPIWTLVNVLIALLFLLWILSCLGILPMGRMELWPNRRVLP